MTLAATSTRVTAPVLQRRLRILGVVNVAIVAGVAALSFAVAGVVAFRPLDGIPEDPALAAVRTAAAGLPLVDSALRSAEMPAYRWHLLFAHGALLASSTLVFLITLRFLRRCHDAVDDAVVETLFRFAVSFAVVSFAAHPIFTRDLWFYVAEGRMFAGGHNGYYAPLSPDSFANLPLGYSYRHLQMTYGPLWALMTGIWERYIPHRPWVEYLGMKALLTALWLMVLALVRRSDGVRPPESRALGLLVFGWMPVSSIQTIAEGHNDIAMALLVVVWMALALSQPGLRPAFAVFAAMAVKYASAPLIPLHFGLFVQGDRRRRAVCTGIALLVTAVLFANYWRGPEFFSGSLEMESWRIFSVASVIEIGRRALHLPELAATGLLLIWRGCVGLIVLASAARFMHRRSPAAFAELVCTTMFAVLFGLANHVWPWFVVWVLAPAAFATGSAVMRIVLPFALAIPFAQLPWIVNLQSAYIGRVTLALWGLVAVAAWSWRPPLREAPVASGAGDHRG